MLYANHRGRQYTLWCCIQTLEDASIPRYAACNPWGRQYTLWCCMQTIEDALTTNNDIWKTQRMPVQIESCFVKTIKGDSTPNYAVGKPLGMTVNPLFGYYHCLKIHCTHHCGFDFGFLSTSGYHMWGLYSTNLCCQGDHVHIRNRKAQNLWCQMGNPWYGWLHIPDCPLLRWKCIRYATVSFVFSTSSKSCVFPYFIRK
jgi:hypothetical protein